VRVRFAKYEGLGNDFVVVDSDVEIDAARICDRRYGVGADGVIFVLPPRERGAARMRVVNADGSVPEMCGNGIRCVALHLARGRGAKTLEALIETDAGPRACSLAMRGEREADVAVDMGVVRATGTTTLEIDGENLTLETADAGNPHAILFGEASKMRAERLGPAIAKHPYFPHGTNVELASVGDGIDVVVWERGVGITLACGTGACAVAVVARAKNLVATNAVRVRLPGGALDIEVGERTKMRGPARFVFEGILA